MNLIIVLIVGTLVGALTGLAIGNLVNELYLAMIAGILATLIAGVVRNTIMTRVGKESHLSGIPQLMIIYSAFTVDRSDTLAGYHLLRCSFSGRQHRGGADRRSKRTHILGLGRNISRALRRYFDGNAHARL